MDLKSGIDKFGLNPEDINDDHTVLHRDVEIATDKHLLAAVVLIVDRLLT